MASRTQPLSDRRSRLRLKSRRALLRPGRRPRSPFRRPQDHVAVAIAGAAHGSQPVHEARLKPYLPLAVGVRLMLVAYGQGRSDGLEGGGGDGDADHVRPIKARGRCSFPARRSIRVRAAWRSIALGLIHRISGRERNGHACRRAAGHCDSHEKDKDVSHRRTQRRALR